MKTSIKYLYIYVCGIITGIIGILAWIYVQIYRDPVLPTEDEWEKEWKEFSDLPPGAGVDTYLDDVELPQMAIDINGNPYWYGDGRYTANDKSTADTQPIKVESFQDWIYHEPDASDLKKWAQESE